MTKVMVMSNNSDSQCYFVQLQIDGYLDGDLSEAQQTVFMSHVQDCAACAKEFHYAQVVQDAVLELPQIDCGDMVLEPIYRLTDDTGSQRLAAEKQHSIASRLADLLNAIPGFYRYGLSAALVAVIAVAVSFNVPTPSEDNLNSEQLIASENEQQYSPEEIAQALNDLNLAIEYLNQVSQRTEVMIADRFLVTPIQDSINASFQRARIRESDPLQNGPI